MKVSHLDDALGMKLNYNEFLMLSLADLLRYHSGSYPKGYSKDLGKGSRGQGKGGSLGRLLGVDSGEPLGELFGGPFIGGRSLVIHLALTKLSDSLF